MHFDLIDLRLYLHVLDTGNITAGAARSHLSLAAASARIRAMEAALGVECLERGRRGVTPTPAGKALAVDREAFARAMTERVAAQANLTLVQHRVESLDDPVLAPFYGEGRAVVLAAGPMASDGISASLAETLSAKHCYFYDAIAPIVWTHSLNMDVVFRASRYGQENGEGEGEGDYLNCPMSRDEYDIFYAALLEAQKVSAHEFEQEKHFEGCMPIEALAERGPRTLTFGPLKPVGFVDPRTGRRPWAIVQLRAENANSDTCNLVGCQTKLTQGEQARVFRLVPGLENAEFARFGSMHRNTYVNAPEVLAPDLSLRARPGVYLAGQITGVEGYVESAASGLWLGMLLDARARGHELPGVRLQRERRVQAGAQIQAGAAGRGVGGKLFRHARVEDLDVDFHRYKRSLTAAAQYLR